jgi:hypothetical protein
MAIEQRAVSGAVAGVANFASIILQNLLLVPIFLGAWGKEEYGIWLSLLAAQAIIQTANAAHQGYVGNEINRIIHEKNHKEFAELAGSSLCVAVGLGLVQIIIVVCLVASGAIHSLLGISGSGVNGKTAAEAFLILIATWMLVGPAQGVLIKVYAPLGLYSRGVWWSVAGRVLQSIAVASAVWKRFDLRSTALVYGGTAAIVGILMILETRRLLDREGLWEFEIDLRRGMREFGRSLVICAKDIVEQSGSSGLVLVVGRLFGLAAIPTFTTLRTLANTAMQATNIIIQPVATDLIRLHVKRKGKELSELIAIAWFAAGVSVNMVLAIMLPIAPAIYMIWVRNRIGFNHVAFDLFVAIVIMRNIGAPLAMYLTNNNHLRFMTTTSLVRNTVALGVGILGGALGGLQWLIAGLLLAEILASVWLPLSFGAREISIANGTIRGRAVDLALVEGLAWLAFLGLSIASPNWSVTLECVMIFTLVVIAWQRWHGLNPRTRERLLAIVTA